MARRRSGAAAARAGKSLRFALLPEGQDPDDLARSGGRAAIEEVIAAARGLADVSGRARPKAARFATPERRAALEARIGELTGGIRDEVVRRYYRQDLTEACSGRSRRKPRARLCERQFSRRRRRVGGGRHLAPRTSFTPGEAGPIPKKGRASAPRLRPAADTINRGPYQVASPQLALSPIMRGQRTAISRREALILRTLINHPWLLHDHLEEVVALEMAHPEADKLRAGITAAFDDEHHHRPEPTEQAEKIRADLKPPAFRRFFKGLIGRSRPARWGRAEPARRPRTFFRPGTSWCPCIANGTPYLGN